MKIIYCAYGNNYLTEAKVAIESLSAYNDYPVELIGDYNSVEESAGGKLRILEDIPHEENEIMLYLDTDIVTLGAIPVIDPKDKICMYGYPNRSNAEGSFAGFISTDKDILSKQPVNGGMMLFRATKSNRELFSHIYNQYINGKKNSCWEQPYLNYWLHKTRKVNINLNDYVFEYRYQKTQSNEKQVFCHFCGLRTAGRVEMMRDLLNCKNVLLN